MRHNVCGRKLNRTKSHRDAMFANMVTSLFEHKKLHTTEAKAKELRPFAETLITKAKTALAKEKQKLLPTGQTIDIHSRRLVARHIRNKAVLQELFDAIAPTVETRNGGYCRITKTGTRRGDAARTAIIELVDWSAPVDGATTLKKKKKQQTAKPKATTTAKATTNTKQKDTKQPPAPIAETTAPATEIENITTETIEATTTPETKTVESNTNEAAASTNIEATTTEEKTEPTTETNTTESDTPVDEKA